MIYTTTSTTAYPINWTTSSTTNSYSINYGAYYTKNYDVEFLRDWLGKQEKEIPEDALMKLLEDDD